MTRTTLNARVNADGVLQVPLGKAEANRDVQVTIEPLVSPKVMTSEEWKGWVDSMAGTWVGEFERIPIEKLEEREPF